MMLTNGLALFTVQKLEGYIAFSQHSTAGAACKCIQ